MELINKWFSKLRIWVPISVFATGLTFLFEATYVQHLLSTGLDPLRLGTDWVFEIPYLYFGLINLVAYVTIIVLLMGFMLRSAQLIKRTSPSEFTGKPGWAIWGFLIPIASYFLPYQVLNSIRNFAKSDVVTAKRTRFLLLAFWIPNALANYIDLSLFRDIKVDPTYSELVDSSWMSLVAAGLSFASAIFLLRLIPALHLGIQTRLMETPPTTIDATS